MSRLAGMFTVSRDSMVSSRSSVRRKLPTDRGKLTDKESGFESNPNSPRAESALEPGQQPAAGSQDVAQDDSREEPVALENFNFIKKLGSGGYGSVVLVQKEGGRDHKAYYALKITNLNRAALVEREILPRLQNVPYTLDLAYAFYNPDLRQAYLALPYAIGKDLFALAGPSTREPGYLRRMFHFNYIKYLYRVRIVLAELCVAISHLHKLNILYRDLKLENILVFGDGHIRLADFGLSKLFEEGESTQISGKTGTPDYMAPEVLRSSGSFGPATTYSFEADLWGLGVIAYELIVGQLPFRGHEVSDLENAILHGGIELPRAFVTGKYKKLEKLDQPLLLAALSFVKALLQRVPQDRISNEDIPQHIFFQDLDFEKIATGDHDDAPFDIIRIRAEEEKEDDIVRVPTPFAGMSPRKLKEKLKNLVPDKNGFDQPAKYVNYPYVSDTLGWYFSALEGSQCEDSRAVLPDNVGCEEEATFDTSLDPTYVALDDVPGLLDFEATVAEDPTPDNDDLIRIAPDDGDDDGGDDDAAVGNNPNDDPISSSPTSTDSVIDEDAAESDVEAALPPMAASTPVKDEIELFPRVRVVPADSIAPSYSPSSPPPRVMPKLLNVSSAKRKLNLDLDLDETVDIDCDRRPAAPPTTPTTSAAPCTRRQLDLDLEEVMVAPGRRVARRLHGSARATASPARKTPANQPAVELSWASLSSVHQSCAPSRFERDSPLSPTPVKKRAPAKHSPVKRSVPQSSIQASLKEYSWASLASVHQSCTPSQFERDSPLSPSPLKKTTAKLSPLERDSPMSPPPCEQAWLSLSSVHQSCTPSRFERDSPLSPSPAKQKIPAKRSPVKGGSPQSSRPVILNEYSWASLSSVHQSCTPSRFERDSPLSPSPSPSHPKRESPQSPTLSEQTSVLSEQTMTSSEVSMANSEQTLTLSEESPKPSGKSSSSASSSKRSWASPAPAEPTPPRPRRRRAAPAVPSPDLPLKKRRRFRSPSPAPTPPPPPPTPPPPPPPPPTSVPTLSELGRDGPRVIVQAAGQPLPPFSSLRSPQLRQLRSRTPGRR